MNRKLVINTRPEPENKEFTKKLQQHDLTVYEFPTIKTSENMQDKNVTEAIKNSDSFDWIIFTSVKGVDAFIKIAKHLEINEENYTHKKIAVVGPKTKARAQYYGFSVDFMPTRYTTSQLAKEIQNISNKKILLARSNISSKQLVADLENKGAIVTDIAVYDTVYVTESDPVFQELEKKGSIDFITFTSPSTVKGFLQRIQSDKALFLSIPVLSIGPITTTAAQEAGFKRVYTAKQFTTDSIVETIKGI